MQKTLPIPVVTPLEPSAPPSRHGQNPLLSAATATAASSSSSASVTDWKALPPCPITGYTLTQEGLVDIAASAAAPPQTKGGPKWWFSSKAGAIGGQQAVVSRSDMMQMIRHLRTMEQEAKNEMDEQLPNQVRERSLHGLELAINPCLLGLGVYMMTWKTARLYKSAIPRHSILLTKFLSMMRWRLSVVEKEAAAQRHRRLMMATNSRVALTFSTGAALVAIAWKTRPDSRRVDDAPNAVQGRERVAYEKHTSSTLKWMWYVYYNHPAYADSVSHEAVTRW